MISQKTTLPLLFIFPLLVVMVLLGTLNAPTMAAPDATITVDTLLDENDGSCIDGDCSLRDAIAIANAGDTIDFSIAGTITLSSTPNYLGELIIDKSLTIDGLGTITVSGNNAVRVFNVLTGTAPIIGVTFDSIIIANGYDQNLQATNCPPYINLCGGGIMIQNSGATITLSNSILISNTADWGGGIFNHGTLLVISSTISENSARSGGGGGIVNAGMMMVNDSTIFSNSATGSGGGIFNAGGSSTGNISSSTLASNTAYTGGGIFNYGVITISNSTFSGNSAIYYGGGISNVGYGNTLVGIMMINNSTITNNRVNVAGGGIHSNSHINTQTILTNTIASGNVISSSMVADDLVVSEGTTDSFISGGHNLIGTMGVHIAAFANGINGDKTDVNDPILNPLSSNGGNTLTHALLPGSPAIDSGANCGATDQRGIIRNDGACDIGAFESRGFTLALVSGTPQTTTITTPFTNPLVLTISSTIGEPVEGGNITFIAPTTGSGTTFTETVVIADNNGYVNLSVAANGAIGSYTVSANAIGNNGNAITYTLTNTSFPYAVFLPIVIK